MSQHDYNLANASGSSFRADLNDVLGAIVSLNSGGTAPSTTFAYMLWADTGNGLLKQRNAANSAWIIRGTLAEARVAAKSGIYTVVDDDFGKTFTVSGSWTLSLTAAATLADGFEFFVRNTGSGSVVIDPSGAETIDGAATVTLTAGQSCRVVCDGSAWYTIGLQTTTALTQGTSQPTTSGTAFDFTSIPSNAKRIVVTLNGVSTNGTSNLRIQLGDSGGIETSGYNSSTQAGNSVTNYSSAFETDFASASAVVYGQLILTLCDASNTWIASGDFASPVTSQSVRTIAGSKQTSATLDRIRLTTANGTDTFDAGAVNIQYEG